MMQKRYETEVTKLNQNNPSFFAVHASQFGGELDLPRGLRLYCQEWRLQILVKICNADLRDNEHSHPNTGKMEE